jgi:hypothetical protein
LALSNVLPAYYSSSRSLLVVFGIIKASRAAVNAHSESLSKIFDKAQFIALAADEAMLYKIHKILDDIKAQPAAMLGFYVII